MRQPQLLRHAHRDDKRIQGLLAQAVGNFIEHGGKAHPPLQPGQEVAIGQSVLGQHAGQGTCFTGEHYQRQRQMFHLNAQALAGLEAIHDLQVMGPRFRPVLPGV